MRDRVEFSEYEVLEQLQAMIAAGREEEARPQEEFQELLSSLPVEVVNTTSVKSKGSSDKKQTLLQAAAYWDNVNAMNLLLIKGVDPKTTGEDNRLATEIAVESNSMDVVDLLWGALKEEVPEEVRVQQLSRAMFKKDLEEGKRKFTELLSSLSAELLTRTAVNGSRTVLTEAVLGDKIDFVRRLLDHGVDPRFAINGASTLDIVKEPKNWRNCPEIAVLIYEAVGEELSDQIKVELLSRAMYKEDKEEFAKHLSSLSPQVVATTAANRFGSVLRDAVFDDKIDFIRLLLEHGVDPTIGLDKEQTTPLQLAARKGSLEIITLFAELVKDPKSSVKIKLLKLIIECEEEQDANVEAFKQQLKAISEVAQRDIVVEGNLLHFAVVNNLKEHVRILLKHGCDPKLNMPVFSDRSPLETAIENDRMEIWSILVEQIGEFSNKEKLQQLRIMVLAGMMDKDASCKQFKELLESLPVEMVTTSCIEAKNFDQEDRTLMQEAVHEDNKGVVSLLLETGVDPRAEIDNERSLTKIAVENNSMEVVDVLWKALGEEVPEEVRLRQLSRAMYKEDEKEAKKRFSEFLGFLTPELVANTGINSWGSVLQDAVFEGKTDFVRLLLAHGVDPTCVTEEKVETPLEIAEERRHTDIVALLLEAAGEELPDNLKIQRLSEAMYKEDVG